MLTYKYLIIGGGMTADAAVRGIRSLDQSGLIGIISSDSNPPYKRPPLSKGLWKGEAFESIWLKSAADGATLHLARTATAIRVGQKQVVDEQGVVYAYEKLLFATGGRVRTLPFLAEGIIYYRTVNDFQLLKQRTSQGNKTLVIGGGFIGSEIAAALAMNGQQVSMIFPDEGIGSRVYPKSLSKFLNEYYVSKGVNVIAKEEVTDVRKTSSAYQVTTNSGKEYVADTIVAGIGIQPNIELAQSAGLEVGNGVIVNEFLQTLHPDIFAAGDVANFYSQALAQRTRVEHEDNALTMGALAGRNMAGASEPYQHLPFFYSDLFELGYEAVGELDSRLETFEDWKEPFREGVVYYLKDNKVRGVLLWNTWSQVDNARSLIAEKKTHSVESLKGRLPS